MNNVITKEATSAAYVAAKEEFGVDLCRADRQTKSGVKTRSEIGISMSGNRAERDTQASKLTLRAWCKGDYESLRLELMRVFSGLNKGIESWNKHVNATIALQPDLADRLRLIRTSGVGKMDIMGMVALAQQQRGAEKGEKAKLLACFKVVNEYELFAQNRAVELMALPAPVAA